MALVRNMNSRPPFLVPVPDESQSFRVVLRRIIPRQLYLGIREDVLRQSSFPPDRPVLEVALGADDEERLEHIDAVEALEVVVAAVEDVERPWLIGYYVHRLHVVHRCRSDVDKSWNLGLDIVHRVYLDSALRGSEPCPLEHVEAQVDGGRVECVGVAFEFEDVSDSLTPRLVYHVVGEVLKGPAVTALVGLGQITSRDMRSHPKEVAFAAMGFQCNYQVSQALTI